MTTSTKTCEKCQSDDVVGISVRGVYDGVLFWACRTCKTTFHRWAEPDRLHAKAEIEMAAWRESKLVA